MIDQNDQPEIAAKPDKGAPPLSPEMLRTGGWVAAAGMGIGSAALVAALLYANCGGKGGKKPE